MICTKSVFFKFRFGGDWGAATRHPPPPRPRVRSCLSFRLRSSWVCHHVVTACRLAQIIRRYLLSPMSAAVMGGGGGGRPGQQSPRKQSAYFKWKILIFCVQQFLNY
jgi:hypothetical protein